jgi:hypothetical protein
LTRYDKLSLKNELIGKRFRTTFENWTIIDYNEHTKLYKCINDKGREAIADKRAILGCVEINGGWR